MAEHAPVYMFEMERVQTMEYNSNVDWRDAVPITVVASTEQEARDKVFALSMEIEKYYRWKVRTVGVFPKL